MIIAIKDWNSTRIYSTVITVNNITFFATFNEFKDGIYIYYPFGSSERLVTVIPQPAGMINIDLVEERIKNAFFYNPILKYLVRYKEAL